MPILEFDINQSSIINLNDCLYLFKGGNEENINFFVCHFLPFKQGHSYYLANAMDRCSICIIPSAP